MQALIAFALPFIVNWLTSLIKRIPLVANMPSQSWYAWTVRGIAFAISFASIAITYAATGTVDENGLGELVSSFLVAMSAIAVHEVGSKPAGG